ncbi:MAG TPA: squalene--hopene cyclase [Nitrospiraceae bacterium]|nr:squalene--hopene cyclase [Nitrospiraceae bacterium]
MMNMLLRNGHNILLRLHPNGESAVLPSEPRGKVVSNPGGATLIDRMSKAIRKTQAYYLGQQHHDGYWWYELESNVTITAEYIMLLHYLGIKEAERDKKLAAHIMKNQRDDGTWALHWGGKGDLSTTVEAYFALKLVGYDPNDWPLRKARQFILEKGGMEAARVFTKIYLALFGEFEWKALPSIPIEFNLFPPWFPLNIYSISSWARATIVPLSILLDVKPVRSLPERLRITELYKEPHKVPPLTPTKLSPLSWKRLFIVLDRLIKAMEVAPVRPLREKALEVTEKWILEHQEPSGDWGGIQPAMVNSILALAALGKEPSSEPIKKGLEALERFTIEKGDEIVLQSCISPVWDTALTSLALLYSGMDRDHFSLINAGGWLASKQIFFEEGDWKIKKPGLKPGGWAFEFENNWYPDVDDTTVVLMLLYRYADKGFIRPEDLNSGLQWILGMQGKDGGWGAFDVDNNMKIMNQLPFGDLEAMIDPSTADLTGRVLELLGLVGYTVSASPVKKAIKFLKRTQEADGSWWGRWGINYIYGTSSVLLGLASIGEDMSRPYIRKAVRWLKNIQNSDGGWGECCESYEDPSLKCLGRSTPSQSAWSLLALIAVGECASEEVINGVDYLLKSQRADGTWDEKDFTGTGFPKFFLINYHNYRNCFPLMALGKFFSKTAGKE